MSSPATEPIADMRVAVRVLLEHADPSARRFGGRLVDYLEHAPLGAKLEVCLGLVSMNGEAWWRFEARVTRDNALRELAMRFYADRKTASAAYEISKETKRYAASAWRFDRSKADMPPLYRGTRQELLWRAFTSGAKMPLERRQLATIIR